MSREALQSESAPALFRQPALRAVGHRLFGEVAIVVPPSGRTALFIAALSVAALAAAICIVEVPQRSRAVGVLMPAGGFVDVVAQRPGQVVDVFVSEGELVPAKHRLVTIGDGTNLHGQSASQANLRSLQHELQLLNRAHESQQAIAADRLNALDEQMDTALKQREIADDRHRSIEEEVAILERRVQRWQVLLLAGHVARDAFELEQARLIRARGERAEFQRRTVDLTQGIQTISRLQTETRKRIDLNEIEHALGVERLQRDIDHSRYDAFREIRSTNRSVIAQVLVQPGDAVRSGQVLAKLRQPGDRLQAWLYLSTSSARLLRPGQSVEISLDAYPRQVYGTHTAVVSSVSGIALLPKDIRAPLLLAGPTFEVRAELKQTGVKTEGRTWPLSPGISFSAEIIQRRLKLYEWLFRSSTGDPGRDYG